jgi:hypothetical protein
MELLSGALSAFGLSTSAGLNAYIPLLVIALTARYSQLIQLGKPWDTLTNGWIIALLVLLTLVEFFADKIPAVNHLNDVIQTVIRPVAGAIAFAASARVITEVHPVLSLAAGLILASGVHVVKAAAIRPAVTATTAGAGNLPVSMAEDVLATLLSIIAAVVPVVISVLLVMGAAWVTLLLWRQANRERNRHAA